MTACAKEGFRPFLLGATPAVLERAERALAARHPGLAVAGRHHGYFTVAEEDRIAGLIRASGADCLFIAMPTPRKERFMHRYRNSLGVPFCMGVGGTFDVIAGHVRRAPPAWAEARHRVAVPPVAGAAAHVLALRPDERDLRRPPAARSWRRRSGPMR